MADEITDAVIVANPCDVMHIAKVEGASIPPRCVLCYQREGNPGDCDPRPDRFMVQFGAAGGVILCAKACDALGEKLHNALPREAE